MGRIPPLPPVVRKKKHAKQIRVLSRSVGWPTCILCRNPADLSVTNNEGHPYKAEETHFLCNECVKQYGVK